MLFTNICADIILGLNHSTHEFEDIISLHGNRLSPSRVIAWCFAALQHLHFICNDGTSESSARYSV